MDTSTRKQTLLELPDDEADSFEAEREQIERDAEESIGRALEEQRSALFPEDLDPTEAATQIQQRLADDEALERALREALEQSADLGVRFAIANLDTIAFAFDWTLSFAEAREYADEFAGLLVRDINQTTLSQLRDSITRWIDEGAPLDELIDDIAPLFGQDRAELIASTEVTRAYAGGAEIAYRHSGVVEELQWFTANDERVCPICAPLGGLRFTEDGSEPASEDVQEENAVRTPLGTPFVHPGGNGSADKFRGQTYDLPPAHPRCRCSVLPVI